MGKVKIIIICSIMGGFIGMLLGAGETTYTKNSQKGTLFPILTIGGLVAGLIAGIILGNKIAEEEKIDKHFGFDNMEDFAGKSGRKWIYESRWKNPETGTENIIKTGFEEGIKEVVTNFNSKIIIKHQTAQGDKKFIEKVHIDAKQKIIKGIKSGELKLE
jgi:hypothetical protein